MFRKPCRPTCFLRHHRKREKPATFYCVDEFFAWNDRHAARFLRVDNSLSTLSKSPAVFLSLVPSISLRLYEPKSTAITTVFSRQSVVYWSQEPGPPRMTVSESFNRCQLFCSYRFNSLIRSWEVRSGGKPAQLASGNRGKIQIVCPSY